MLEVDTNFSALEGLGFIPLCLGDKVFVPLLIESHAFYFMKLEGSCSGVHKPQVYKFCTVIFSVIFGEFCVSVHTEQKVPHNRSHITLELWVSSVKLAYVTVPGT